MITGVVNAQNTSYLGTEDDITQNFLRTKALETDFGSDISKEIWKDSKNTYYCVDYSAFSTKFEKITILEATYTDNAIVSIGNDNQFMYFLVNNTMNVDSLQVNATLTKFHNKALKELETMNDEQMRLWLIQHDKEKK